MSIAAIIPPFLVLQCRHQQYQYQVLRYWHGIGIENTTSSGIGIGIGIESLTFQVLELVLKKMTSGIGIGIDLLSSWDTAIG